MALSAVDSDNVSSRDMHGMILDDAEGGHAAIVPESLIEALRAAEDAEDAAEADAAMDEPGESIP
jgi:hypothetical protein